mgnify:FL=1
MKVNISLKFTKGYIANPYWPELEKLINIHKESGMNRSRTAEGRVKALDNYLHARNLDMDAYRRLETAAERPFYRLQDLVARGDYNGRKPDEIVISAHQVYGCLVNSAQVATSGVRISRPAQLRSEITVVEPGLFTGKLKADGLWERFVVVTTGAGAKLSNQRALRSDPYIEKFEAQGALVFSEAALAPERVRHFLEFAGREVGMGASRKLAWGRFEVSKWEPV